MVEWIERVVIALGYSGIAGLMFVANFIPFFPSDLILPCAGFVVGRGDLSFGGVVVAGTLGSVAGQLPLYYLARRIGKARVKRWVAHYGRVFAISPDHIETAQHWFDRYGAASVLICRLIPTLRALISFPAGIAQMNMLSFTLYSTVGIALWTVLMVYLGQLLGEHYAQIAPYLDTASYVVIATVLLIGIGWWLKQRKQQLTQAADTSGR